MAIIKSEFLEKLTENKRVFDLKGVVSFLKKHAQYETWKARYFYYFDKGIGFLIEGHSESIGLFLTLSAQDTFTLYLVDKQKVIEEYTSIYLDDLVEFIDSRI